MKKYGSMSEGKSSGGSMKKYGSMSEGKSSGSSVGMKDGVVYSNSAKTPLKKMEGTGQFPPCQKDTIPGPRTFKTSQ